DFLGAYVADAAGTSLLHVSPSGAFLPGGLVYADRAYFKAILATRRAVISGATIGRLTHVLTIQIVAPIVDDARRVVGLTCSSLNLGTITQQAARNVRGLVDGRLVFVDSDGRRIADSDAPHS